jgi:hypothetical protein
MAIFDSHKPRSGLADARRRERELKMKLERLMEISDEETFKAGLKIEFGIGPGHPKYELIMNLWRCAE